MLLCLKMKSAKTNFECSLVDRLKGGDSSIIYRYLRNFTGSNGIPQTIYLGNVFATTDSDKASFFNKYFHSVYSTAYCDLPSPFDFSQTSQMLGNIFFKNQRSMKFKYFSTPLKLWAVMEPVLCYKNTVLLLSSNHLIIYFG